MRLASILVLPFFKFQGHLLPNSFILWWEEFFLGNIFCSSTSSVCFCPTESHREACLTDKACTFALSDRLNTIEAITPAVGKRSNSAIGQSLRTPGTARPLRTPKSSRQSRLPMSEAKARGITFSLFRTVSTFIPLLEHHVELSVCVCVRERRKIELTV